MREELIRDLIRKKEKLRRTYSSKEVDKQHELAKLTARERIETLLDPDSFVELNVFTGSSAQLPENVITGYGTIDKRPVAVFS